MHLPFRQCLGIAVSTLASILLNSCGQLLSPVRSYQVAKQQQPPHQSMMPTMTAPDSPEVDFAWKLPKGWESRPASAMRLASFYIPPVTQDPEGSGDVSVVILGGEAGGLEANINRWREQIGLTPATAQALQKTVRETTSPLGKFSWTQLENPKVSDKGILAALVTLENGTLFIKMVAPLAMLKQQKESFLSFCRSFRWKDDQKN